MKLQLQGVYLLPLFLVISFTCDVFCQTDKLTGIRGKVKNDKALSVFQVIKFPNVGCVGSSSSFNGTCYTSSECLNKGGTSSGTCANGFGVCCTFMIGCGSSTTQNCTYFQVTTASAGSCGATFCKCSPDVCQLRLDFNTFVITGPSTSVDTVTLLLNGNPSSGNGIGVSQGTQCLTDTFSVTSPQGSSPPVICGANTGQHMYVDASTSCNQLNFNLGTIAQGVATIATRTWSIKVTQISCYDYTKLAPPGCTQYYTGTSGTFQSYNFNPNSAGSSVQLANQRQNICFRQERNFCRICYSAAQLADFAVSGSPAKGGIIKNSLCCDYGTSGMKTTGFDCVMIPGASKKTNMAMVPGTICGNSGGLVSASGFLSVTVCSKQTPFLLSFNTDNWSFTMTNPAAIKGFKLNYQLFPCT